MTKKEQQQMQDHSEVNRQPKGVQDDRPGYGDKKLEGPNRPSE